MFSVMTSSRLPLYSKLVVAATFGLIFVGALVTSWHAGMAVPDWPLSFGSLNPDGWWANFPVRLEHGHRFYAAIIGVLVGVLCAWVWDCWRALGVAAAIAFVLPFAALMLNLPPAVRVHSTIWPAAAGFLCTLFLSAAPARDRHTAVLRALAVAAFVCVCVQATLGGLRVTRETAGAFDLALTLRIVHGTFSQIFLCSLVALAAMLSPKWRQLPGVRIPPIVRTLATITVAAVLVQLVMGATMRHMGAGLAIPTFPEAAPDGSWLPPAAGSIVATNFSHTRLGAILITILAGSLAVVVLRTCRSLPLLTRPAVGLLILVAAQFAMGVFIVWHGKPKTLTTFHVVNGAAVLATALLIALRASAHPFRTTFVARQPTRVLQEVAA